MWILPKNAKINVWDFLIQSNIKLASYAHTGTTIIWFSDVVEYAAAVLVETDRHWALTKLRP